MAEVPIGLRIKKLRLSQGLNKKAFAEKHGLDISNFYKWEKGHKPQDPEDYLKLERILKLESVPSEIDFLSPDDTKYEVKNYSAFTLNQGMRNRASDDYEKTARAQAFIEVERIHKELEEQINLFSKNPDKGRINLILHLNKMLEDALGVISSQQKLLESLARKIKVQEPDRKDYGK